MSHIMKFKLVSKYRLICAFVFLSIVHFASGAKALILPGSLPLPKAISQASVIVVANIVSQVPDAPAAKDQGFSFWQLAPPAQYTLHVLANLKGQCAANLQIHLPEVSSINYGESRFDIKAGHHILLLLNPSPDGILAPVDNAVPLIRLADAQSITDDIANTDIQSKVVSVLISSLSEPSLRTANISIMKDVVDPSLPMLLFPYLNDSDTDLRSAVLFCLASNQQVAAIPRIAQLSLATEKQDPGSGSLLAMCLNKYKTVEAVPYLNPLVVTQSYGLRKEAMTVLYKIADKSSIPYLIVALRDPDPNQIISAGADLALHRLIPTLKPVPLQSHDDYIKHREERTQLLYVWWADELSGKHVKPGDQSVAVTNLPDDLTQLHPLLFSTDALTRRAVALKLENHADASSVPLLVLALQDPDETVVYSAYKTLHRLVSDLGPATNAEQFRAHREAHLQRIYSWWSVYLGPKPFQPPDTTGFIPLPNSK